MEPGLSSQPQSYGQNEAVRVCTTEPWISQLDGPGGGDPGCGPGHRGSEGATRSTGHHAAVWYGRNSIGPFEAHALWFDKTQTGKSGADVKWEIPNY